MNKIVFTNLNGLYIIKCECLDILRYYSESPIYDINFAYYCCNKVKIIELYNINKDIVDYIFDYRYNIRLKIDSIISLESFKKNVWFKKNFYFKTFLGAFIDKNKIDNIKYNVLYTGKIIGFKNDIVEFQCFDDFLKFEKIDYFTYFYNINNEVTHYIYENSYHLNITYYLYDESYKYKIKTYNNEIEIIKLKKEYTEDSFHEQIIICNKELKILKILEQNYSNILYKENRDVNGIVIDIKEYNPITDKLETKLFNNKSFLINSEKNFPQELLDFYNLKIKHYSDNLIHIRNYELNNAKQKLLNEIIE